MGITTVRGRAVGIRVSIAVCSVTVAIIAAATMRAQFVPALLDTPGLEADGSTLLPTGWRLSPAGRHLALGDLPLNLAQSPDSKYLVVANEGLTTPTLSVVDVASWTVKSTVAIQQAWYGLAWTADGGTLYVSGAGQNTVQEFGVSDGTLTPRRTIALPSVTDQSFTGGLTLSSNGTRLFVTRVFAQTLSSIDLASGKVLTTVTLPAEPYTCVASADGQTLYVSLWGGARVQVCPGRLRWC